jgi:hypothetical protein
MTIFGPARAYSNSIGDMIGFALAFSLIADGYGPTIDVGRIRILLTNGHFGPQSLSQSLLTFPPFIGAACRFSTSRSDEHSFHDYLLFRHFRRLHRAGVRQRDCMGQRHILKPLRRKLGVAHGTLDVGMPRRRRSSCIGRLGNRTPYSAVSLTAHRRVLRATERTRERPLGRLGSAK